MFKLNDYNFDYKNELFFGIMYMILIIKKFLIKIFKEIN